MKKLFIVLAVATLGFVACNNESKTEETTDTLITEPTLAPTVDTTIMVDTTVKVDSLSK
ncbi:MAG: PG1828 family lipoprotein [Chitinophagaceae bacterium]